ncbi:hypothetical protein [Bradyrhizobium erythrophlei]|uniref:hypothetical protein n=1 Tax=Bradyrhizobium erythrophlei TaxID=1437360 RepID=UPI000B839A81|nr:hypothetical protein [Bradyrhizobium erythrophlei]
MTSSGIARSRRQLARLRPKACLDSLHKRRHYGAGSIVSLATVIALYFWLDVSLVGAAFTYLLVLVLLSLVSNFLFLDRPFSFIGVGCLFSAPLIYRFRVDYPQDLITISAFVRAAVGPTTRGSPVL